MRSSSRCPNSHENSVVTTPSCHEAWMELPSSTVLLPKPPSVGTPLSVDEWETPRAGAATPTSPASTAHSFIFDHEGTCQDLRRNSEDTDIVVEKTAAPALTTVSDDTKAGPVLSSESAADEVLPEDHKLPLHHGRETGHQSLQMTPHQVQSMYDILEGQLTALFE